MVKKAAKSSEQTILGRELCAFQLLAMHQPSEGPSSPSTVTQKVHLNGTVRAECLFKEHGCLAFFPLSVS